MANRFLVAYDLHQKTETAYKKVADAIKSCGDAFEVQESVWVVYSEMTRDDIGTTVYDAIAPDDQYLVTYVKGIKYSRKDDGAFTNYLANHPYEK